MQNDIQKFKQDFVVFEKPGILYEKLKNLRNSNYQLLNTHKNSFINNWRSKENKNNSQQIFVDIGK